MHISADVFVIVGYGFQTKPFGGLMEMSDLAAYTVREMESIKGKFNSKSSLWYTRKLNVSKTIVV